MDVKGVYLVGSLNPSEKYEFVSWGDEIPNIWKHKSCSKPPTMILMVNQSCFMNGSILDLATS